MPGATFLGFHELIPPALISIFNPEELELLISGLPEIDVEDLRENTIYEGCGKGSQQVQWFWKVLREFSDEEKAWFMEFVTGSSHVPLEGFKALPGGMFTICQTEGIERLPTSGTCFNRFYLPKYATEEQLRSKVVQAVHEAHEGFGLA